MLTRLFKKLDLDCGWCSRAGLIDYRGRRKPAWDAFRAFVGQPRR